MKQHWILVYLVSLLFFSLSPLLPLSPHAIYAAQPQAEPTGSLIVRTSTEEGNQGDAQAKIYTTDPQTLVSMAPLGKAISLSPGAYRVELDVLGGTISRERVLVKADRTSNVIISEVAELQVNILDKKGQDLGLGVEIYDGVSKELLGEFLSGERIMAQPGVVDVKVATPPQSRWWRDIELRRGGLRELTLRERVRGQLWVHPLLNGRDVSPVTHVIIYAAGTQKEIARSEPGQEHRFSLDTGSYDVLVTNPTGQGKPFILERAEVPDEKTVEKNVRLDAEPPPQPPLRTPSKTHAL